MSFPFPVPKKAGPKAYPVSAEGVPIKAAPKAPPPPPLMLYGAFKAGVKPEDELQYNQVAAEEPQVTCQVCLSHGKRTEVYLGRLPWQTRCVRCKSSWRAEDLHAYHEIVLGMAPSLPWRYHLRHSFQLSPAPQVPTDFGLGHSAPPPGGFVPQAAGEEADEEDSEVDPWDELAKTWKDYLSIWTEELEAKKALLRGQPKHVVKKASEDIAAIRRQFNSLRSDLCGAQADLTRIFEVSEELKAKIEVAHGQATEAMVEIRAKEEEFLSHSEIFEGQKKGYNKFTGEASEGAEGAASSSSKAEPEAVDLSSFSIAQQEALMRQIQENLKRQHL